jgi:hypothetical protein
VPALTSSSFTAINQPQTQLLTPGSSATCPTEPKHAWREGSICVKRQRNPAVAQYLGLGSVDEPEHLERYAPFPDEQPSLQSKAKKRRRLVEPQDPTCNMKQLTRRPTVLSQKRVSESLRVTKPQHKSVTSKVTAFQDPPRNIACNHETLRPTAYSCSVQTSPATACEMAYKAFVTKDFSEESKGFGHCVSSASSSGGDAKAPFHHFGTNGSENFDVPWGLCSGPIHENEDERFDDDLDDDEFLKLTSDLIVTGGVANNHSSSPYQSNAAHATVRDEQRLKLSAPISVAIGKGNNRIYQSRTFVSPVTLTTRILAATGDIDSTAARKPIVRSAFPNAVRDRSPIIGLSSNMLLRTCFRIGEAINQAHQSSKSGKTVLFELYARILYSERDDTKQYFTFCDLFHGKPPYVKATYAAGIWKPVQLFSYDCQRLLRQGRICRCTGTMKRDGKEWTMTVSNIWEATWDDIKWVEGIVDS